MPNHSPTHLAKMAQRSAAQRRTDKLARLVADAPALNPGPGLPPEGAAR